jgi:hypothetical protein
MDTKAAASSSANDAAQLRNPVELIAARYWRHRADDVEPGGDPEGVVEHLARAYQWPGQVIRSSWLG